MNSTKPMDMTLKEELEILRGKPIKVSGGDPMDIPCIETSDAERLCKHPMVSVHMITYNHEPYIRRAIEGVMMQKTDFEFELVIGEDASTDKTREICFDYQKKHPDKIRVLWWHENLRKVRHPAGGNARRVTAHCRGEFLAICEGDDWWTDPLKLQKQVDVMRRHPNVGFCFANARIHIEGENSDREWNATGTYRPGVIPGREFMLKHLYGVNYDEGDWATSTFLMTASVLIRKSALTSAKERHDIFDWKLILSDTTTWLGLTSVSDAYYLPDKVSVYNQVSTGLCKSFGPQIGRDALIVRLYYHIRCFDLSLDSLPRWMMSLSYWLMLVDNGLIAKAGTVRSHIRRLAETPHLAQILHSRHFCVLTVLLWLLNRPAPLLVGRFSKYILPPHADPKWIVNEYAKLGIDHRCGKPSRYFQNILVGIIQKCSRRPKA